MITRVLLLACEPGDGVARLQRGGMQAAACASSGGEAAAAVLQSWAQVDGETLVVGDVGGALSEPGVLAWADVAAQLQQQAHLQPGAGGSTPGAPATPTTEQVMQAIVQYNRQQSQQPPVPLVVGYVMKAAREQALASQGLLHLLPVEGVCFMPLNVDSIHHGSQYEQQHVPAAAWQQGHIDLLLHKGSDELVVLPPSDGGGAAGADAAAAGAEAAAAVGVGWSPRLRSLQAWLAQRPHICVVDPFEHTAKVLDRLLLAQLLEGLAGLVLPGGLRARGPRFAEVTDFAADGLADRLSAAGLQPPCIVKPRVACGVAHSHSMALLLAASSLPQLQEHLPRPALVQEFVNHGGQQFKVYVMGQQVFVTRRASIPDIDCTRPAGDGSEQQPGHVLFDSLASLPTQLPAHLTASGSQQPQPPAAPDHRALEVIAAHLRERLGLSLFGFDVVVAQHGFLPRQQQHQELVLIDVNYFPNYRGGGADTPALFRAALKQCWQHHQQ